jgi:hypothetical protein
LIIALGNSKLIPKGEGWEGSCKYGTLRFSGHCACWSGAFNLTCEMGQVTFGKIIKYPWAITNKIATPYKSDLDIENKNRDFGIDPSNHPTCSSLLNWGTVLSIDTIDPPLLDQAVFVSGFLKIQVSMPLVNGRADGVMFLNNPDLNKTQPHCTYPISKYITKEVVGCRDIWKFSIPWDLAVLCDWNIKNLECEKEYRGQIVYHNHEWVNNIQEMRFTQSILRIKLKFRVYIAVSLDSVAINQPNLTAAITRQIIPVQFGENAVIQLTTLFKIPYTLANGDIGLAPPDKVAKHILLSSEETCDTTGCKQRWVSI